MRVVHCVRSFSPLSQTFIYDYVVEMQRQGVEVHVHADRRENSSDRPFGNVHLLRQPALWHPARMRLKLGSAFDGTPAARGRYGHRVRQLGLAWALRRLRPDVVHAHFGPEGVAVLPVARRLGIPLVVTFYGFDASRLAGDAEWVERYRDLWPHAARVVVLSQSMLDTIAELGCPPEKCTIIHLAKDLSTYSYTPRSRPIRRFLSVGRLVEKKGFIDVIDAMAALGDSDPEIELTIVGDGPLRPDIAERVRQHGLQDRVRLVGAASQARVMELMRQSDAFVLASRTANDGDREGTPTVIVEAQAFGLPVVATWHAGIPEQIPSESHGLLAPEGDAPGIAARMKQLSRATPEEIGAITRAGRALVERDFNLRIEVERLLQVYRQSLEVHAHA